MYGSPPSWAELERLVESADLTDRAFVTGELQLRFARHPQRVHSLHAALRQSTLRAHAATRDQIARGKLRGDLLRRRIEQEPPELRDHFIEELLDITAPLEESLLPRELVHYCPSGWTEIVHTLEHTRPNCLADLGSGMGKVVLLTALLTESYALGIEVDTQLARRAQEAAVALNVTNAAFVNADARVAELDSGDVFYLYVPFTGTVLDAVMARLADIARGRRIVVCSQALDAIRYPWLKKNNAARQWLEIYES